MYIAKENMNDWNAICKAYAKQVGAELLFVNNESFGIMYPDETFQHIYVEELQEELKRFD